MLLFLKIQMKYCPNFEFYVISFFIPFFQLNTGTEPTHSTFLLIPNTGMEPTRSSGMEPFHSVTVGSSTKHTLRVSHLFGLSVDRTRWGVKHNSSSVIVLSQGLLLYVAKKICFCRLVFCYFNVHFYIINKYFKQNTLFQ